MKKLPLVEAADAKAVVLVVFPAAAAAPEPERGGARSAEAESYMDMDLHFFVGPTVIGRLVSSKLDQSWHVDLPAEADEQ